MILPAAFLFSVSSDLPHVFVIVLIGMVFSLVVSKPLAYSDRSVIYSAVAAIALSVLLDLLFPMDRDRFEIIGQVMRTNLTGPFLLYLAVIITLYESTPYTLGISACFSLGALMLGGEILNRQIENQRLFMLNPLMGHFYWFYTVVVVIEALAILVALRVGWRVSNAIGADRGRWRRRLIMITCLAAATGLSVGGLITFYQNESKLRDLELFLLRVGMRHRSHGSNIVFGDDVDLNRTISGRVEEDPSQIVLRSVSSSPPGYLRGRVYTRYANGRWRVPESSNKRNLRFVGHEGILTYKTFYVDQEKAGPARAHIYPAATFFSDVLLVPGNGGQFDVVADALTIDGNGVLDTEDWEKDGGYTVFAPAPRPFSAYPSPSKPESSDYLDVPEELRTPLARFLKGVDKDIDKDPPSELVEKLIRYFHTTFTYSLETDNAAPGTDPVLKFLLETHSGHCELFAAATALILRNQGIPTRYVTGFVCMEPHPTGNYHVARLGDAHAWLEYFNAERDRWEPVEPTPPSGIPNGERRWGTAEPWLDAIKQSFAQILADMRRGHFAKAIIAFFAAFFNGLWWLLVSPWRGPLILGPFLVYAIIKWRGHRSSKSGKRVQLPPELISLRKDFEHLERAVAKSFGLVRSSAMTIEEWIRSIESEIGEIPSYLRTTLNGYQRLRYGGRKPDADDLDALTNMTQTTAMKIKSEHRRTEPLTDDLD